MKKSRFSRRIAVVLFFIMSFIFMGLGIWTQADVKANADGSALSAKIENVEWLESLDTVVFYLSETDFITAEFDETLETGAGEQYKWVSAIAYEDRHKNNVHNALLDKNLSEYNYGEYVLIDGVPLKNIWHELRANKFQRIEGLGISCESGILSNATEIEIKKGCTFPTLARGYFGVEEPSAIIMEEGVVYRKREGQWVKTYAFDGYEEGVIYDASEAFFYKRSADSNYKGHAEAPTMEFSRNYEAAGDYDYVLTSSKNTVKGNLFVMDFVNPIDTSVFGVINLRFHVHEVRTMETYNANGVTENSLGQKLEEFTAGLGWTNISLRLSLYADNDGMVETLVFRFTNDGDLVNAERNYVGVGEFSLVGATDEGLIYEKSLTISETETDYCLSFRFNKKGKMLSNVFDFSKFCINGVSLKEINADGDYVQAEWISLNGIYQINVTLSKAYQGEGQIKNADVNYACNKISVLKGFAFPNKELLDKTYHYHLYSLFTDNLIFENEIIIDVELEQSYQEAKILELEWDFREESKNNLYIGVTFDQNITTKTLLHVCEPEAWRESALGVDPNSAVYAELFNQMGYKSSLMDSIVINGKTIGEFHARNAHQTCVMVHYGSMGQNWLGMWIDSDSNDYSEIAALFKSGNGVTLEFKKDFIFPTGVKIMADYKFILKDGVFVLVDGTSDYSVYYDGQLVHDGDTLKIDSTPMASSIWVDGTDFEVTKSEKNGVVTFTVKYNGQQMSFSVEQTGGQESNPAVKIGCGASILGNSAVMLTMVSLMAVMFTVRRKQDE